MTISTILRIIWGGVVEVIAIDDSDLEGDEIRTRESWPQNWDGRDIVYSAKITKLERRGNRCELHLNYRQEEQQNPGYFTKRMGVRWGTWEISWDNKLLRGSAKWVDEKHDYDDHGKRGRVVVYQWQPPSEMGKRKKELRRVGVRPDQGRLRKLLLESDKSCAITGNKNPAALDVAHIIDASNLNYEVAGNAILLRADLHRLFDKNLIRLVRKGEAAYFRCPKNISMSYLEPIDGVSLKSDLFKRIKSALAVREQIQIRKRTS